MSIQSNHPIISTNLNSDTKAIVNKIAPQLKGINLPKNLLNFMEDLYKQYYACDEQSKGLQGKVQKGQAVLMRRKIIPAAMKQFYSTKEHFFTREVLVNNQWKNLVFCGEKHMLISEDEIDTKITEISRKIAKVVDRSKAWSVFMPDWCFHNTTYAWGSKDIKDKEESNQLHKRLVYLPEYIAEDFMKASEDAEDRTRLIECFDDYTNDAEKQKEAYGSAKSHYNFN